VWLVLAMLDGRETRANACVTLLPAGSQGNALPDVSGVWQESMQDGQPGHARNIRSQCQAKIERLKDEDGVSVR